jgi:hypothetical protein
LTRQSKYAIRDSVMKTYSTAQVARMIGVHKVTLQRWLLDGKTAEPKRIKNGGVDARVWTDRDVVRIRKYKEENYRKGRGRKAKPKR